MRRYSIEPRTKRHVKGYVFLLFARKYKKQLLNTGLYTVKAVFNKLVMKQVKL